MLPSPLLPCLCLLDGLTCAVPNILAFLDFDGTLANVHTLDTLQALRQYREHRFNTKVSAGVADEQVLRQQLGWEKAEIDAYTAVLQAFQGYVTRGGSGTALGQVLTSAAKGPLQAAGLEGRLDLSFRAR